MQQCVTIYHVHNMLHLFGPWDKISISHHFSFNAHSHPIWGLVVRFNEGRCSSNCISIFLNCIFIFQYFFLYFCISELYFYISELFFLLYFSIFILVQCTFQLISHPIWRTQVQWMPKLIKSDMGRSIHRRLIALIYFL